MKSLILKISLLAFVLMLSTSANKAEEFQGQAYYVSKSTMELGSWGARMSEAQKKQVYARLKNRLEKTYILTFNKQESIFDEEEKLDAISGATDSWGKNFSPGKQYKNVKANELVQSQEFYGKKFLVKDKLQVIEWEMHSETKQIGKYNCFKATASIPTAELAWYNFSWSEARQNTSDSGDDKSEDEVKMTEIVAWYSPQIPVSHGPSDFWGLPGLILEVNNGNTTMLCSKIIMNPDEKIEIEAPKKGNEITKKAYKEVITKKMKEFRENRMGRRRG